MFSITYSNICVNAFLERIFENIFTLTNREKRPTRRERLCRVTFPTFRNKSHTGRHTAKQGAKNLAEPNDSARRALKQYFLRVDDAHIFRSRACRHSADGVDIAERFIGEHGNDIRWLLGGRLYTAEQESFLFCLCEKRFADFITAHSDIDLFVCVDKTCDCFHFRSSKKIITQKRSTKKRPSSDGRSKSKDYPRKI